MAAELLRIKAEGFSEDVMIDNNDRLVSMIAEVEALANEQGLTIFAGNELTDALHSQASQEFFVEEAGRPFVTLPTHDIQVGKLGDAIVIQGLHKTRDENGNLVGMPPL